jgi:hypothetical protein
MQKVVGSNPIIRSPRTGATTPVFVLLGAGADLDRLRETYLPTLGATVETPGGDYRYRA